MIEEGPMGSYTGWKFTHFIPGYAIADAGSRASSIIPLVGKDVLWSYRTPLTTRAPSLTIRNPSDCKRSSSRGAMIYIWPLEDSLPTGPSDHLGPHTLSNSSDFRISRRYCSSGSHSLFRTCWSKSWYLYVTIRSPWPLYLPWFLCRGSFDSQGPWPAGRQPRDYLMPLLYPAGALITMGLKCVSRPNKLSTAM